MHLWDTFKYDTRLFSGLRLSTPSQMTNKHQICVLQPQFWAQISVQQSEKLLRFSKFLYGCIYLIHSPYFAEIQSHRAKCWASMSVLALLWPFCTSMYMIVWCTLSRDAVHHSSTSPWLVCKPRSMGTHVLVGLVPLILSFLFPEHE